jgi:sigma-B regulation protein RsbU (phosphoserine phosphatase)
VEDTKLFPGDILVLYTDGITEAFNDAFEEYGEQRLIEILERHRHRCSREILNAIVEDVSAFSPCEQQRDDITLIVAKCRKGVAAGRAPKPRGSRAVVARAGD